MQVRKWNVKKDYPSILKWCNQRDWDSPIPQETLPAVGVMVTDKQDICAAGYDTVFREILFFLMQYL